MRKLETIFSKNNNSDNRFQRIKMNKMTDIEFERLIFLKGQ